MHGHWPSGAGRLVAAHPVSYVLVVHDRVFCADDHVFVQVLWVMHDEVADVGEGAM
jgi:hypothetical protein